MAIAANGNDAEYELSVSFDLDQNLLTGTTKISIAKGQKLTLSLDRLNITGTLLREEAGAENALTVTGNKLILPASPAPRTLYLSYTRKVENEPDNRIEANGITLTSNWYPVPREKKHFKITAELPEKFEAIIEADSFPLERTHNHVVAYYSNPTTQLHLIAGPYNVEKLLVREGLYVYTMFFDEEKQLSSKYLAAAANYIRVYEKELGPFPYNHYVIVANRQPTGYGIPTFTLLGQTVLRLPFIISTSLGHEIVHSWFGNAVEVDYSEGNWCEGLTSYLSDYRFRRAKGEGAANRKESIVKYLNYTKDSPPIPLSEFSSASHNQPMADARRAVGYNRGALFFHELQQKIGTDSFEKGIHHFYTTFNGTSATWSDIRRSVENHTSQDLKSFFKERLSRNYIPSISIENIKVEYREQKPSLTFSIIQESERPFTIALPFHISTMKGNVKVVKKIDKEESSVSIPLDYRPLKLTIDPDYSLLRTLSHSEKQPVLSHFLGADKKLIVLKDEEAREKYQPFIDTFHTDNTRVITSDSLKNQDLTDNSILFLDPNQPPLKAVLGSVTAPEEGVHVNVRINPLNSNNVFVLLSSSSSWDSKSVAGRLKHYGKYSTLQFQKGRKITSTIAATEDGIQIILERLPSGGSTVIASPFDQIMEDVASNRLIYVGETHTSLSDHLLQLRIIEALQKQGLKLAIGMEMFPASSQAALDKYILQKETKKESDFLKESDYFNVWRYDYLFFRDIIQFARKHHIPVIGLNLDRKIVSQVFREGNTDGLDPEILQSLPPNRDLGIAGYAESLQAMHSVHMSGNHGSGAMSGFIQSQGLWDETMAANIANYLIANPECTMVVLAGSQHTRKDFGIPPRVARRITLNQASIINIYNGSNPANLHEIADYFFLADPIELPPPPRIGIVLETIGRSSRNYQKIIQISPHGKAEEAGLQVGDLLLSLGSHGIEEMADLRIAMLDSRAGDRISLKVLRLQNNNEEIIDAEVELTSTIKPPGHP